MSSVVATRKAEPPRTGYAIQADEGVLRTLAGMYQRFVGSQLMTQDQAEEHLEELASAFEAGGAVFAFSMFVASGRVPGPPPNVDPD